MKGAVTDHVFAVCEKAQAWLHGSERVAEQGPGRDKAPALADLSGRPGKEGPVKKTFRQLYPPAYLLLVLNTKSLPSRVISLKPPNNPRGRNYTFQFYR